MDWPEKPKYIGQLSPDMDYVLTEEGNMYAMSEWGKFSTLISADQKGDSPIIDIQYDRLSNRYSVLTLKYGLFVLSSDGETLAHFRPGEQLPPIRDHEFKERSLWDRSKDLIPIRMFKATPGRYLLWGADGSPTRTWLALLDYRGEKPTVRILVEAKQVKRLAENDHSIDIASKITYLFREWHGGKQLLVVGREPMAFNSGWGKKLLTPLWIDFEAGTLITAPAKKSKQYPLPYYTMSIIEDPRLDRHWTRDAYASRIIEYPRDEDRRWVKMLYTNGKFQRKEYFLDPKGRFIVLENDSMILWKPAKTPDENPTTKTLFEIPKSATTSGYYRSPKPQLVPLSKGVYLYFHRSGTYEVDLNNETGRRIVGLGDLSGRSGQNVPFFYTTRRGLFIIRGKTVSHVSRLESPAKAASVDAGENGATGQADISSLPEEVQATFYALGSRGISLSWKTTASRHLQAIVNLNEKSILDHETFALLHKLPGVVGINANDVALHKDGLQRLAEIKTIQTVQLNNTSVTDSGLACLSSLPHLKELYLAGEQFGDGTLEKLPNLPSLRILGVGGKGFTKQGLQIAIKRMPQLEQIKWCVLEREN